MKKFFLCLLRVIDRCIVSVHFDSFVTYFVAIYPRNFRVKIKSQIRSFITKYNGGCLCLISLFSYDQRNTQNHLKLCTFYVECKNWFVDITKKYTFG